MLCRGPTPRLPRSGDAYDIDHLATYLPYVDVLIADRFFADLCNRHQLGIRGRYACEVVSLGPTDIPGFIERIDALVASAPQVTLAERIAEAIRSGGYHEEFAARAKQYLRERGIE